MTFSDFPGRASRVSSTSVRICCGIIFIMKAQHFDQGGTLCTTETCAMQRSITSFIT
ncbi:hypothetical protein D515_04949 [Grimontia indica]|uniref:Uncharacterized protein n=1 Tax=Grimontia indica TaxID=1056512 RepID=R1J041_9GAMM|nr:hypothetical protein D515_04949 [Grimontia indica]